MVSVSEIAAFLTAAQKRFAYFPGWGGGIVLQALQNVGEKAASGNLSGPGLATFLTPNLNCENAEAEVKSHVLFCAIMFVSLQ